MAVGHLIQQFNKFLESGVPAAIEILSGDIERLINAAPGSLATLDKTDDWSFVIKAHAFLEGSISLLLSASLDPRLRSVFNKLELGRQETGKLEFCKALDLLDSAERGFIRALSQLRNRLAHDPRYIAFSFTPYLESLDTQQRQSFYKAIAFEQSEDALKNARENPKNIITSRVFLLALTVLAIAKKTDTPVAPLVTPDE